MAPAPAPLMAPAPAPLMAPAPAPLMAPAPAPLMAPAPAPLMAPAPAPLLAPAPAPLMAPAPAPLMAPALAPLLAPAPAPLSVPAPAPLIAPAPVPVPAPAPSAGGLLLTAPAPAPLHAPAPAPAPILPPAPAPGLPPAPAPAPLLPPAPAPAPLTAPVPAPQAGFCPMPFSSTPSHQALTVLACELSFGRAVVSVMVSSTLKTPLVPEAAVSAPATDLGFRCWMPLLTERLLVVGGHPTRPSTERLGPPPPPLLRLPFRLPDFLAAEFLVHSNELMLDSNPCLGVTRCCLFFMGCECGCCCNAGVPAPAPAPAPATISLPIVLQANSPNGLSNASAAEIEAAVASILGISKLHPSFPLFKALMMSVHDHSHISPRAISPFLLFLHCAPAIMPLAASVPSNPRRCCHPCQGRLTPPAHLPRTGLSCLLDPGACSAHGRP